MDTLIPSTLTAQGQFSNVQFMEQTLITKLRAAGRIRRVICNFGDIKHPDFVEEKKTRKTNRGRKPKIKKKSSRKIQGTGKHFNSQITFCVSSTTIAKKIYKIKLFRNGIISIPGGLIPDMSDVRSAVSVVQKEITRVLKTDVQLIELYSIMRNYKFRIKDPNTRINMRALYEKLKADHLSESSMVDVSEVKYNSERYQGLILKFNTPVARNPKKRTTIKIFQSGKINIDGADSEIIARKYYQWIDDYFRVNNSILYTPVASDSD